MDRVGVLTEFMCFLLPLVRERHEIYRSGQTSPSEQLKRLLQLA